MSLYVAIMLVLLVGLFILLSLAPMLMEDPNEDQSARKLNEEETKREPSQGRMAKLHLSGNE